MENASKSLAGFSIDEQTAEHNDPVLVVIARFGHVFPESDRRQGKRGSTEDDCESLRGIANSCNEATAMLVSHVRVVFVVDGLVVGVFEDLIDRKDNGEYDH